MDVDSDVLAQVIEGSNVTYRKSANSYIFTCPRCSKKDKLYLRRSDGRFICFYCAEIDNFRGRPEFALSELLGLPITEVKRRLYGDVQVAPAGVFLDVQLKDWFGSDPVPEDIKPPPQVFEPMDFYPIDHKHATKGRAYLEGRGVSVELAQKYGLRYCPPQQRVVFPVSSHGKLFGWQARTIGKAEPKILSSKGLKRENTLMFADRLDGSQHAVICEGPVDAIKADLCGGNVATMGKIVSRAQINLIRNSGVQRIYLALDPDASHELSALAREFGDLELYWLAPAEGKKDLGEMSCEEVYAAFKSARRITAAHLFIHLRSAALFAL